uniref:hypothetical protein n=1 Tax=uncultured Draconibacterium sp. TaxID=1573823 RepID=UPI003217C430
MKTVDRLRKEEWGSEHQVLEAYPGYIESKKKNIDQHFIVPWELMEEQEEKRREAKSSGQVAFF